MSASIINSLLWAAAISCGLMAGIYFAFSVFIMQSFAKIKTEQAIAAMNSINKVILRSLFMPLFFGSSIISVLLIIVGINQWNEIHSVLILLAGAIYLVGMFMCTVLFNVPLNNALANQDPKSEIAQQVWTHYLTSWTKWNHLRTMSSLVTCTLCIFVLSSQ